MRSITAMMTMTAALFTAGCAARVGVGATVSNDGYGPDLVYAAPGVQVIADFDQPIFFADNFYWRFDSGTWYRSPRYTGGWVYATPPQAVRRIDRPHTFVHYRPQGWVARREPIARQPMMRDRRGEGPRMEPRRAGPAVGPMPPRQQQQGPRGAPPGARDRGRGDHRR